MKSGDSVRRVNPVVIHCCLLLVLISAFQMPVGARADTSLLEGNPAAMLLRLCGADTVTVELVRGIKKEADGRLSVVVEDSLRAALQESLSQTTFRLAGLDRVVQRVQKASLTADGRVVRLEFMNPAEAEQARVILKGYSDLILGMFQGMPPAPSRGMEPQIISALTQYMTGTRFLIESQSLRMDLPDPAPVNALLGKVERERPREPEPTRAERCWSNMRTMEGAMEVFLMDKPNGPEPTLDQLLSEGYLRTRPECPEKGSYVLRGGSSPTCSVHGQAGERVKR